MMISSRSMKYNNERLFTVVIHSPRFASHRRVAFLTPNNHQRWCVPTPQFVPVFITGSTCSRRPQSTRVVVSQTLLDAPHAYFGFRSCCGVFIGFSFLSWFHSKTITRQSIMPVERNWVSGFLSSFREVYLLYGKSLNIMGHKGLGQGFLSTLWESLSTFRDSLSIIWDGLRSFSKYPRFFLRVGVLVLKWGVF